MRSILLISILYIAGLALAQTPPTAQRALDKDQILSLITAKMDNEELARRVQERGIDFDLTEDYIQKLQEAAAEEVLIKARRAARPRALTREQILQLVAAGVPDARASTLVKQRGIDFLADEKYLDTLRVAGAGESLISAVRQASDTMTAEIVVATSPGAEVYLDGNLQGRASGNGELTIKAMVGAHTLKVSHAGKKDYQQTIALHPRQTERIAVGLEDLPGRIGIRTGARATVSIDGSVRGTTDAAGDLVLDDVTPGAHTLVFTAPGKKESRQTVTVRAGQETRVEARLQDAPPTIGEARVNSKDGLDYVWIPRGEFIIGCSKGDDDCFPDEKPSHRVTLTRAFWIGQTEVTVGAFKRIAQETTKDMPKEPVFSGKSLNPGWENSAMPMVNVNWHDATAFCAWAGGRLPTEAEWEYAARAESDKPRQEPWEEFEWYADNSGRERFDSTQYLRGDPFQFYEHVKANGNTMHEIRQKRPNGYNLYDMLGNVREWTSDWYGKSYYQSSPARDPRGPAGGQMRVLRGSSWGNPPRVGRTSSRYRNVPGDADTSIGFRCVRDTAP